VVAGLGEPGSIDSRATLGEPGETCVEEEGVLGRDTGVSVPHPCQAEDGLAEEGGPDKIPTPLKLAELDARDLLGGTDVIRGASEPVETCVDEKKGVCRAVAGLRRATDDVSAPSPCLSEGGLAGEAGTDGIPLEIAEPDTGAPPGGSGVSIGTLEPGETSVDEEDGAR
jgi:hypothetical protein